MVYVVMKRMYYDSVKDHLNCARGVNRDEEGHSIKDKLLNEFLNISYIDYTYRSSVVFNSNYSDLSHSDLNGLTNENISIKASCSCVYLNATDINRFVI